MYGHWTTHELKHRQGWIQDKKKRKQGSKNDPIIRNVEKNEFMDILLDLEKNGPCM